MQQMPLQETGLYDALQLAFAMSGKSVDDVASEMGWTTSNANRIVSRENYWPSLPSIPRLCVALGNGILLDWLAAQAAACGLRFTAAAPTPPGLVCALGRIFKEVGEVSGEVEKAIEDGTVSQAEARRILREVLDVRKLCESLTAQLRVLDPAGE